MSLKSLPWYLGGIPILVIDTFFIQLSIRGSVGSVNKAPFMGFFVFCILKSTKNKKHTAKIYAGLYALFLYLKFLFEVNLNKTGENDWLNLNKN